MHINFKPLEIAFIPLFLDFLGANFTLVNVSASVSLAFTVYQWYTFKKKK